ncbi:MAG: hypothetical protein PSV24_11215 [Rhodoferax sp.]|nr:hypothetical protein [Rhodoferax sp.]
MEKHIASESQKQCGATFHVIADLKKCHAFERSVVQFKLLRLRLGQRPAIARQTPIDPADTQAERWIDQK